MSTSLVRFQPTRTSSPWSILYRVRLASWSIAWPLLCRWTPKPFNGHRILVLRLFGCQVSTTAFVHQRAYIAHPWNVTIGDNCCIGDSAVLYSLGPIVLHCGATIAQEAYLCTASHDFSQQAYPLLLSPIVIGENSFVGARAFILPGITVGSHSVIGACSVVTRSVAPHLTVAGNPARPLHPRI